MAIYTRRGDQGKTTLGYIPPSGTPLRVSKSSHRLKAMSSLDHAMSFISLAMFSVQANTELLEYLASLHFQLSKAISVVSFAGHPTPKTCRITRSDIEAIEAAIDSLSSSVVLPRGFTPVSYTNFAAIRLNLARTALRVAEIDVNVFAEDFTVLDKRVLALLNRSSDLLYVAQLWVEQNTPQGEGARD